MNKKREALRHGLRSFIEDTSRELADLEGRAPRPSPAAPVPVDGVAPSNGAGHERAPRPSTTVVAVPPAIAPPQVPPTPAARPAAAPRALPAPKPAPARAPRGRGRQRSTQARPRLPQRVSPDGDGVDAAQAHARKGVCFAYFLNQACWRVPDAYCNSALQVCITRECPVYHLHKDALERRFAKKFQHFW